MKNRFWLQLIGDYARLLIQAFAPDQTAEIQQTRNFINQFDNLLARSRQTLTKEQLDQLNKDAATATQNIQKFFLQMLSLQVRSNAPIFIKPAVINNAVTFTQEYLYLLNSFMKNERPITGTAIQLEIYWLPVFIQIAKVVSDSMGLFKVQLRQKAEDYSNIFINLFLTSMELEGISRIGTDDFPMYSENQKEAADVLKDFSRFLESLISLSQQNRIPGTLSVLYLDRSIRLVCYVLRQLAVLSDTELPECDPASPRLSNI